MTKENKEGAGSWQWIACGAVAESQAARVETTILEHEEERD
jgi:hypothetical protein